jgi:serine/threonine protein kinase
MSLAPGIRINPYEVLSMVGAGGMGEVYRARDTRLKRDDARKVLLTSSRSSTSRLSCAICLTGEPQALEFLYPVENHDDLSRP